MPGYQCKFIGKVHRKYICPLCRHPMRDPVQITTCDHHYCDTCLQEYLSIGIFQCPEDNIPLDYARIYPDDDMADEISSMTVRCNYHRDGCQWFDELQNLQDHLENCLYDRIPCTSNCSAKIPRKQLKNHLANDCPKRKVVCDSCGMDFSAAMVDGHKRVCSYEKMSCINNCGAKLQRRYMSNHNLNECPKRSIPCKYCKKQFIYDTLQNHLHECPKYPIVCPNRCDPQRINREDIERHLIDDCPSAAVACPFEEHGCKHNSPRFALEQHLDDSLKVHLALVCEVAKKQQDEIQLLRNQIDVLTSNTDGTLLWKIKDFSANFNKSKKIDHMQLQSPCFYTSRFGYKLGATLFLNGNGSGEGTHMSLYVKMLPGEYDGLLQWPFTFPIEFKLFDQTDDSKRRKHIREMFTADPSWKNFHRPSKDVHTLGYGYPTFLSHEQLKSIKYIKDDCVFIKIAVDTSRIISLI
ncbi:TNF receptor-associated factor 4-like [Glandiceps talaboti]